MKQQLKTLLEQREKQHVKDASRTSAAVLVPIYLKQGQYHVLFTRRTEDVMTHKGQISFPGGVYETRDSTLVNTALRESWEEIGLQIHDVEIIGELDDTPSFASNYLITPFVGFIPWPYQFHPNAREVAEIIEIPILALLDKESIIKENRGGMIMNSYDYRGNVIWGATARILSDLLTIITVSCEEK